MDTVGIGPRFFALLVDWIVFFALGVVVGVATGPDGTEALPVPSLVVWCGVSLVYYVALEATLGASLGKLALGLRVVDTDGDPITGTQALVRNLLRFVDLLFFGAVGAAFITSSAYNQRLGDRAAGTFVVRHDRSLATA